LNASCWRERALPARSGVRRFGGRGAPVRRDRAGEQLPSARDATHHRADRDADDVGDLGVLESVDVVELDRRGEVLGDLRQRAMNCFAVEPGDHLGEQRVLLTADQLVVRAFEPGDEYQLLAPARLLARVTQHRAQDAIDPRAGVGVVAQIGKAEPGTDERFLHRILGVGHRVRPADREGEQPV